ncbi:hypothetical protein [Beijerinckia sp. L45]|nr:hypothetical protein [Beijerinckia sp. L45]
MRSFVDLVVAYAFQVRSEAAGRDVMNNTFATRLAANPEVLTLRLTPAFD